MDLREVPAGTFLRHPWELARAEFFVRNLVAAGVNAGTARILDVGAGDAWFTRQLLQVANTARATCWDVGYEQQTPPLHERVTYCATKPTGTFDWILLMDVLEHVPDDRSFLKDVLTLAAPNTQVLVSVPAWPGLYTNHDEALRHYRRYAPEQARRLLLDCGLDVRNSGGLFWSLLLPRYLMARGERRGAGETLTGRHLPAPDLSWKWGRFTQHFAQTALRVDRTIANLAAGAGIELPGLSFFAWCQVRPGAKTT